MNQISQKESMFIVSYSCIIVVMTTARLHILLYDISRIHYKELVKDLYWAFMKVPTVMNSLSQQTNLMRSAMEN